MKIAITAKSSDHDGAFEPRFGRCAYFIFLDTETQDWHSAANPAGNARGGAGTQAAQFVANQDADAVISGQFGPNAHTALKAAGIEMYRAQSGSVSSIVEAFQSGELKQVASSSGFGGGRGRGRRRR
ncbi:MAG: NifB/NifX family molybdenum-iron cluster-binding protein [Anaerolineales bacterium]